MLTKEIKIPEFETMTLVDGSSGKVQNKSPPKLKDLESFTLPISIENSCFINVLCDTNASIKSNIIFYL